MSKTTPRRRALGGGVSAARLDLDERFAIRIGGFGFEWRKRMALDKWSGIVERERERDVESIYRGSDFFR